MINTPQNIVQRRIRLGGSNVIRHIASSPSGVIGTGGRRTPISILSAAGFDVHISTSVPLSIGQRVTVLWGLSDADHGVAMPGIVHWLGSGKSESEAGIALQEKFPEDYAVKLPGCPRTSIRYACTTPGSFEWTLDGERSVPAVVMNYSREGLCLQVPIAPPVETKVRFSWQSGNRENCLEGIVRWIIGQEDGFLSGCELIGDHGYRISGINA